MVNFCISVDWLQCYCIDNQFVTQEIRNDNDNYPDNEVKDNVEHNANQCAHRFDDFGKVQSTWGVVTLKRREYGTQLWQCVYDMYNEGYELATICRAPRSSSIPANAITIKLSNRMLYQQGWVYMLEEIMSMLNVSYKGITRLDICCDLNELNNGMQVDDFLMQYFTHAPFCAGHIVRNGSRKIAIQASRNKNGATSITGMRWGSSRSDVGVYCYNKTLEMLEVKEKPWIVETWKQNGLISSIDESRWNALGVDDKIKDEEKRKKKADRVKAEAIESGLSLDYVNKSVWRFEISIKSHGQDIINLRTGELFRISPEYLSSQSMIEELFYTYANKYLDFRISTGQTQIKNYKKMNVFPNAEDVTMKPSRFVKYADTGRVEKMIANKLNNLYDKYSHLGRVDMQSIRAVLGFLNEIRGLRGIANYCAERTNQKELATTLKKRNYEQIDLIALDEKYGHGYPAFVEFCRLRGYKIDAYSGYNYWQSLVNELDIELMRETEKPDMSGFASDITPFY